MRPSIFIFKMLVLVGILHLAGGAFAQKANFLYIQSEPKVPYTVQMGDKTFQSNNTGYLKIPSLEPNSYTLVISFPKSQFATQTFVCDLKDKDRGFWLKQDIDNNMVLMDMVSLVVIKNAVGTDLSKINYENKLQKTYVDSISTNAKGERIKISNPNLGNGTSVIYKPAPKNTGPATSVTKTYEKVGVNGINQAFAVLNGSKLDTIFLFIPALDDVKDNSVPNKRKNKADKENTIKEEDGSGPTFDLPMPSNAVVPKKAKSVYK